MVHFCCNSQANSLWSTRKSLTYKIHYVVDVFHKICLGLFDEDIG